MIPGSKSPEGPLALGRFRCGERVVVDAAAPGGRRGLAGTVATYREGYDGQILTVELDGGSRLAVAAKLCRPAPDAGGEARP